MPMTPDTINALFEIVGAAIVWANVRRLWIDRAVRGVLWQSWAFFAVWGGWNLFYYPALGQWWSAMAAAAMVAGNLSWLLLALWIRCRRRSLGCGA